MENQTNIAIELAEKIKEKQYHKLNELSQIKSPARSIWMSLLGHPCERYICYKLSNEWNKETPLPIEKVPRIIAGNYEEQIAIQMLNEMGFLVKLQSEPVELKLRTSNHLVISGKLDGVIFPNGAKSGIPCEIKTVEPHIFPRINSLSDLLQRHWSYQRYKAQLQLYMLGKNKEYILLILKSRGEYNLKAIPEVLDYEYAESLLQKAERIAQHYEDKTFPEPINHHHICPHCGFTHICPRILISASLPKDLSESEKAEIKELCKRRAELYPLHKEFEQVDKALKEKLQKAPPGEHIIADWFITIKEYESTQYQVPMEIKKQYAIKKKSRRINFEFLGEE